MIMTEYDLLLCRLCDQAFIEIDECPNCGNDEEHSLDLRHVLDRIKTPDYTQSIHNGDMEIYFKPMTYKNLNDNNQLQFEQQKLLQVFMKVRMQVLQVT